MLDANDILNAINEHCLSVRKIPEIVVSRWSAHNPKAGDKIVNVNGRDYVQTEKIPEHAGWYMCQSVKDTGSMVRWSMKEHHLAPTLGESVELFLKSLV